MLASLAAVFRFGLRWPAGHWLGAALPLASVLGLGAYYETNDDGLMTLLLTGQGAGAPVADMQLYCHGFSQVWAWLYGHWPGLPWYGLTLYGLLLLAFTMLLATLNRAAGPRLGPAGRGLLLSGFYFVALLESAMWFSLVRVALLLAGAGLLLALQRAADPHPRRAAALALGVAAALLAGLLRPSAALLGLLAVAPAAAWLPGRAWERAAASLAERRAARRAAGRVLGWFAGLALAAGVVLGLAAASPEMRYRRQQDALLAQLNDYDLRRLAPATTADSVALSGARRWWLVADSAVFNAALLHRATRLDWGYFGTRVLPGKLLGKSMQLARDYFPMLAGLALLGWLGLRPKPAPELEPEPGKAAREVSRWRWYLHWLVFAAMLLGLAGFFKLPPRLAGPLLALFLAVQLLYALPGAGATRPAANRQAQARGWALAAAGLILLLYAAKTAHRVHVLRQEQLVRSRFLHQLQRLAGPRLVAVASYENALKSLSPFRNYGPRRVLLLSGWPTLDASQPRYRQQLSGQRAGSRAVQHLAADSSVLWLMPPAFVPLYNRYLARTARLPAPGLHFRLRAGSPLVVADTALPVLVRPARGSAP